LENVAEIIKAVMSSASESELGVLFINAQKAVIERTILQEMGHRQPPTPIQTDNSTAEAIINAQVQPKRTKAMDMCFHWLRDCSVNQEQFRFYWRPGPLNFADLQILRSRIKINTHFSFYLCFCSTMMEGDSGSWIL
jgi:hypothetical protein